MSDYAPSRDNLLSQFPSALTYDKSILALAYAFAEMLAQHGEDVKDVDIYQIIDELPEGILDILAYDFKVDWWDYNYSVEEKRRLLKNSWRIHRFVGTPAAVSWAIDSIFGNGEVQEWFDYDGEPHHFRAFCCNDGTYRPVTDLTEFYKLVNVVKRRSSWLDGVVIGTDMGTYDHHVGGRACITAQLRVPEAADDLLMTQQSTRGGQACVSSHLRVPEAADDMSMQQQSPRGGRAAMTLRTAVSAAS